MVVADPYVTDEDAALVDAEVMPLTTLLEQSDFVPRQMVKGARR